MSTRSIIAVKIGNKIHAISCHQDGEITGVGQILSVFYDDLYKIKELISLGHLSFIGSKLTTCFSYHRDRNDEWEGVKPRELNSLDELLNIKLEHDFIYYHDGNKWVYKCVFIDKQFKDLKESLNTILS